MISIKWQTKIGIISIITASIMVLGCKKSPSSPLEVDKSTEKKSLDSYALLNQHEKSEEQIAQFRANAQRILDSRIAQSGGKSVTFIEKDIWTFEGIVINADTKFGDKVAGEWMDFKEDMTYTYGNYQNTYGSGRYHYDIDKSLLLLVDNDPKMKPQEFDVKMANDAMVWVGAGVYQDANMQCKLIRQGSVPSVPTHTQEQ